ncbi:hypothetical protein J1792_15990 [Streptomyces triculaminicus]|uniref:Uncharacterized protein n=1 Tax=Streptomyces triculaminicus TaxID=2816232 RepID=A0A939FQK5_9ACTN|nr:hypothetical protein [Streptomyces triculaminicus]MBO0654217.1 hypothetical protein [Streptomyces triculaminicus]
MPAERKCCACGRSTIRPITVARVHHEGQPSDIVVCWLCKEQRRLLSLDEQREADEPQQRFR